MAMRDIAALTAICASGFDLVPGKVDYTMQVRQNHAPSIIFAQPRLATHCGDKPLTKRQRRRLRAKAGVA